MDQGQYTIVGGLGLDSIDVAHSIINNSPKPAYLEGLAVIDTRLYRLFHRHSRAALLAGAMEQFARRGR